MIPKSKSQARRLAAQLDRSVVFDIQECDLCKAKVRVTRGSDGAIAQYEFASDEEHECFDVPPGAHVLVMDDSGDSWTR